ncbi:MAG: FAD:protein FMN transferase [candidate division WOR-3 bacterium]
MEYLIRAQFIMGSILKIGIIENNPISQIAIDSAFKYANYLNSIWYKFYKNFEANGDTIAVEDETDEILKLSLYYIEITDSTFNPFYKSKNLFPIRISDKVWYFPKGLKIDLGGIVKGYVVDKVRDILLSFKIDTFYINFGSSSIYSRNYKLKLYSKEFGEFEIFNEAISISSTIKENKYHIYDPRTSKPIKKNLTVLVICENATECEAYSKAFIIKPDLKNKIKVKALKIFNIEDNSY